MSIFNELEPAEVWKYFEEILQIPRPSNHEEKIRRYLIDFGRSTGLDTKTDRAGNVLITKTACKGMENRKSVILQSHMDMVCEKNSDVSFDFTKDPINAWTDGEWIRAKGTTLGADDGIGMAAQLALLASKTIPHGPLECLFTVAEETGLTGAFGLETGFFNSRILLNLDSEDDGELFIGCAGGSDLIARLDYLKEPVPGNFKAVKISLTGLLGGHSGDDIHKGRGNSIKLLVRLLWKSAGRLRLLIHSLEGGNLRNAIPREAAATVLVHEGLTDDLISEVQKFEPVLLKEFNNSEPGLKLSAEITESPDWVLDDTTRANLLSCLYACPNGVFSWSRTMPGIVETSTNLASVKFSDSHITVTTSQRSSLDSAKNDIANMVESVFLLAGAEIERGSGYPGWNPDPSSEIVKITSGVYKGLFHTDPIVRAIHAGLECGLFLEKYPDLDMISFGPTIRGAHSPDERLEIITVKKFWDLLLETLNQIPEHDETIANN